jgi:hypothetical protein
MANAQTRGSRLAEQPVSPVDFRELIACCHRGVFKAFHPLRSFEELAVPIEGVADWKIAVFRVRFDSGSS